MAGLLRLLLPPIAALGAMFAFLAGLLASLAGRKAGVPSRVLLSAPLEAEDRSPECDERPAWTSVR
eukprot:5769249-Alexandrium_andersonii.AAC.1